MFFMLCNLGVIIPLVLTLRICRNISLTPNAESLLINEFNELSNILPARETRRSGLVILRLIFRTYGAYSRLRDESNSTCRGMRTWECSSPFNHQLCMFCVWAYVMFMPVLFGHCF